MSAAKYQCPGEHHACGPLLSLTRFPSPEQKEAAGKVSVFVDIVPDESRVDSPAERAPRNKWRGRLTRAALPLLSLVVFAGAWQLAAATGLWNQTFVPYPSTVWKAFIATSTTHDGVRGYAGYLLWEHLYMTLRRVLVGVVIGVGLGVALGLIMGSVGWVRSVLEPWLTFLRALPPLAYFFLLVIWLGIDEAPKVTLVAIGAFFPVYVNLVAGIRNVDRKLIEVARVYDLGPRAIARRVVIPASLPSLLTGLRLGLSQAWLFVVVAEFFGASAGLGFRLTDSQQSTRVDLMFVALVCLALLGKVTDMVLHALEERTLRWRDTLATQARA